MRENSRDYGCHSTLHWHDGGTCHGRPTLEACQQDALARGWIGKILEQTDRFSSGEEVRCYTLITSNFDHYARQGRFVVEIMLVALPILET
jgi:hypothetical protein